MPIRLPLWTGNARESFEEAESARYRRDSSAKLSRLQNTPMAKLGPDTPARPVVRKPGGWKINPRGVETPNGLSGGSAMPTSAPGLDDPERDMMPLGVSPRLTAQDMEGEPGPANGMDGVGGPEAGYDRKAALEAALRKERLKAAVAQATASPQTPPEYSQRFDVPQDFSTMRPSGAASIYAPGQVTNRKGQRLPIVEESKPVPTGAQAFMANTANSATFGQLDKLKGAASAMMGGDYDTTSQATRDWLQQTREVEPGYSMAGDVTGFLVPGAGIGGVVGKALNPITRSGGFLGKTANAAAQGAAGGAVYGYTVGAENEAQNEGRPSPGVFARERGDAAKGSAAVGAMFGGTMPALDIATRPLRNAAGGVVAQVVDKFKPGAVAAHDKKIASEAVRRSLERAGIFSVDDLAKRAAKYGDKPVVTGELGQDPLGSLVSLVRGKGTTGDKAMAILEGRIGEMPGRLLKDIADETGFDPAEVLGSIENMVKQSRARANPVYEVAEEAPFAETANLERIVRDSPTLSGMLPSARARVQNQAVARIGQGDQMPPLKLYDELKQLVDEDINKRLANGQGIDDLEGLRTSLVRELDLISGQAATGAELPPAGSSLYAKARDAGGDAPRIVQGVKDGERAMSGARMADDIAAEVSQISGQQLTAYQYGVIRNMVKDIENGTMTPKRVNAQGFKRKLNEVFGEPAANGLIRKFGVEAELSQKGARWNPNVGSVTSQAMMGAPSAAGDAAVRAGTQLASGNVGGAIRGLIVDGISALRRRGYSEAQLNEIGDILLSSPGQAADTLFPGQTPKPGSVPPQVPPAGSVRENAAPGSSANSRQAALASGDVDAIMDLNGGSSQRYAIRDFANARQADALLNRLPDGGQAIRDAVKANDFDRAYDLMNKQWPNLGTDVAGDLYNAIGKKPFPQGVQFTERQRTVWQMLEEGSSYRDIAKKIGLEYDTGDEILEANKYIDLLQKNINKKLNAAGVQPSDPKAANLRNILGPNADKVLPPKDMPVLRKSGQSDDDYVKGLLQAYEKKGVEAKRLRAMGVDDLIIARRLGLDRSIDGKPSLDDIRREIDEAIKAADKIGGGRKPPKPEAPSQGGADRQAFDIEVKLDHPNARATSATVIRNPTKRDLLRLSVPPRESGIPSDNFSQIRGYIADDGNLYVASGYDVEHYGLAGGLGRRGIDVSRGNDVLISRDGGQLKIRRKIGDGPYEWRPFDPSNFGK